MRFQYPAEFAFSDTYNAHGAESFTVAWKVWTISQPAALHVESAANIERDPSRSCDIHADFGICNTIFRAQDAGAFQNDEVDG